MFTSIDVSGILFTYTIVIQVGLSDVDVNPNLIPGKNFRCLRHPRTPSPKRDPQPHAINIATIAYPQLHHEPRPSQIMPIVKPLEERLT